MSAFKRSVIFSALLVTLNIGFLYTIVKHKSVIAQPISSGLTIGILGFGLMIIFAVILTWFYVTLVNSSEATAKNSPELHK